MNVILAAALIAATEVVGELPKLEDANLETFLTEVYGRRPVERPQELWFSDIYPPEQFSRYPEKGVKRKIDALRRIVICHYKGPYGEGWGLSTGMSNQFAPLAKGVTAPQGSLLPAATW